MAKTPAQLQSEINEALARPYGPRALSPTARRTNRIFETRSIPDIDEWPTYDITDAYVLPVAEGAYHIGRYGQRYGLKFSADAGRRPRGTNGGRWHDLGSHDSPQEAVSAADKHYAKGFD